MNKASNKSLSIDKSNWTKVKLGDVVAEPRDTVKDFASEQIEHVVGLEHIDSEDIHLRRSANIDSTTFTKKFSAGDVLFGRRRAYLKKAAQAKFSGICSGDITVMRAKEGLLPELLPFVVNNDKFFDYAVKHSAGGLSPRVKFKDLAHYEFLLPPKDQQAQLAELLWALDEVLNNKLIVFKNMAMLEKTALIKLLQGTSESGSRVRTPLGMLPNDYKVMKVDDFLIDSKGAMKMGPFGSSLKRNLLVESGYKVYGQENVFNNDMEIGDRFISGDHFKRLSSCELISGDFLITIMGTVGKSMIVPEGIQKGIMDSHLVRLQINKDILDPTILGIQFRSGLVIKQIERLAVGGIMAGLSSGTIRKINFIVPPMKIQKDIVRKFSLIEKAKNELESSITSSKVFKKNLINQIF
jgi:type I restriction enzyme S subunit